MKKKIVLATPQRRICSALIDFALGLGVAVLAYFFGINQAGAAIANTASYHELLVKYQVDSGLVIKDNGSYYYLTQDPNKNYSTYNSLKGNLEFYYNDYLTGELPGKSSGDFCPNTVERKDGIEYWYNVNVLGLPDLKNDSTLENTSTYFEYDTYSDGSKNYDVVGVPQLTYYVDGDRTKGLSEQGETNLYSKVSAFYNSAVNNLFYDQPFYTGANSYIQWTTIWEMVIAVGISALIFYFLVPICTVNGQTVGKMVTKLILLDKDGYQYKRWQLIPRFFFMLIVEIYGAVVSFSATFMITYTCTLFTRKRQSLHDLIAGTVVVYAPHSNWFTNREEEKMIMEQERKRRELMQFTKGNDPAQGDLKDVD